MVLTDQKCYPRIMESKSRSEITILKDIFSLGTLQLIHNLFHWLCSFLKMWTHFFSFSGMFKCFDCMKMIKDYIIAPNTNTDDIINDTQSWQPLRKVKIVLNFHDLDVVSNAVLHMINIKVKWCLDNTTKALWLFSDKSCPYLNSSLHAALEHMIVTS